MKRAIVVNVFTLSTLIILSNCGYISWESYLGTKSDQVIPVSAAGEIPERKELEQA